MLDEVPQCLLDTFRQVLEMQEEASRFISSGQIPPSFHVWVAAIAQYVRVMMTLGVNLVSHPEWLGDLGGLMKPVGCPAQKVPLIEKFLQDKGVELL